MFSFFKTLRAVWQREKVIDISDEYLTWLNRMNIGFLELGNLYCFDFAIRNLPASLPIVEIGTYGGLSANVMTYYKAFYQRQNRLITVDPWYFVDMNETMREDLLVAKPLSSQELRQFIKSRCLDNLKYFSDFDLPYLLELFSDHFFEAWAANQSLLDVFGRSITLGGEIGFAYIDGDHSYAQVYRDFCHCDRFLVPGGYLLFDDSADGSGWDVCEVVKKVLDRADYELIIKNPNYFFRKKS